MNFPDRIFAVGGAGKAIALELLETEWVINDLLEPKPDPDSLTVTIIDTAEGEKNTDRQKINEIRENIAEKAAELRNSATGRVGTVDIEYKLITEDIHLGGNIDLIGEDAVPRITAGNGMKEENWWIKERHINENLDFAKGVVRKRGLGKAIYYKAYAEDDEISSYIDLPQKGKVAVLAGLGGGTGSGIVIDLARHLRNKQRTAEITLFGILPNHTEGIKESTNSYAALSELEYLALTDEQVFKDRIIIPIDPTGFDGKIGDRIQTGKLLQELDEAIIYLLTSYYSTEGLEDPFADTPDFAPFTVGIPQVLRYNVEAINEARNRFRDVLNQKEEALQREDDIYAQVDRFLTRNYRPDDTETEQGLRDLDKTDLKERLEDIESWLQFDLFDELDYHSVNIFEDIVSDGKKEGSDIAEQIDIISGSIRAVDTTGGEAGTFVDNIDEHLAEVLEKELRLIGQRKEILGRRQTIDDNRIRDAVEYLIGNSDRNATPGVKLQRLEAKLEDFEERYERLKAERDDIQSELEAKRDEQSSEVERRTTEWIQQIEPTVNQIQQFDLQYIESLLSSLDGQLQDFAYQIENATIDDEVERVTEDEVLQVTNELQSVLNTVGIDISAEVRDINSSLTELKRAKRAFLAVNQEEGTIEKIAPWKSSTQEAKEEANRDYRIQKNSIQDKGVFQLGTITNFTASVSFDANGIIQRCQQNRSQLEDHIINSLQEQVQEIPAEQLQSLEQLVTSDNPDIGSIEEIGRETFRIEVGETEELENQIRDLEAEISTIERQKEVYNPAITLFQEANQQRETWIEKNRSFKQQLAEHDSNDSQHVTTETDDYVYVKNIQPEDIFRATGRDNIANSDLFNSEQETRRVRRNLEELAKNARNQEYTGLHRRKLAKDTSRYSGHKVRVAAASPAVNQIENSALDFSELFQNAFDLGASGKRVESPYTSWRQEVGGPWDIALSIFITGVFFDNIRKVVQADGYHAGYKQRLADLEDDILIHHSFGLEDGMYVKRENLINLEDSDDSEFYLRDESQVVSELLDEYLETVPTNQE